VNFLSAYRPPQLVVIVFAAVIAVITAVALTMSQPWTAQAATAKPVTATPAVAGRSGTKPTIVLVHGAWADSSSWDAVVGLLQQDGYTVDVPPNPLRGVQYDSADLRDFLDAIKGPIVLVGHSYGSFVITNAATGDKQVKALVDVDGYLPAEGETLGGLNSKSPDGCVSSSSVLIDVPFPGSTATDYDTYIKQSWFPGCFANNGIPAAEVAKIAAEQRPLASGTFTDKSGTPAWKTIPTWDVIGTVDKVISPAEQLAMAKRTHAHITEIKAPHLSMVSDPGAVTRVILQAVHATT
jgi:pimeloyl-ACP methyl ester carboxylesterase